MLKRFMTLPAILLSTLFIITLTTNVSLAEFVGNEFRINDTTEGNQSQVSVSSFAGDSGFLVSWFNAKTSSVSFQRLNHVGGKNGSEVIVSSEGVKATGSPISLALLNNRWIIFWRSMRDVYATYYYDEGNKKQIRLTNLDSATNVLGNIRAISLKDGKIVVAWEVNQGDSNGWDIYARCLSVEGELLNDPFVINQTREGNQKDFALSALSDASLTATWVSSNSNVYSLVTRTFDGAGNASSGEKILWSASCEYAQAPRGVSAIDLSNTTYVVAYVQLLKENASDGTEKANYRVYASMVNTASQDAGSAVLASEDSFSYQAGAPSVSRTNSGGFTVAWPQSEIKSDDDFNFPVIARDFSSLGTPITSINVVSGEGRYRRTNALASVQNSTQSQQTHCMIAWESSGQDGDSWGVYGRVLY